MESQDPKLCTNCGNPLEPSADYCHNCGQKTAPVHMKFTHIASELISSLFNLDSAIFVTLARIFIPAKLTIEYFRGRRKRYIHPVRLLLVSAVVLLAAFTFAYDRAFDELETLSVPWEKDIAMYELLVGLDSLLEKDHKDDSLLAEFIEVQTGDSVQMVNGQLDQKAMKSLLLDSLDVLVFANNERSQIQPIKISIQDILTQNPETITENYGIPGFFNALIVGQVKKVITQTESVIRYLIGSAVWTFFLLIPTIAFVLFILYNPRRHYYIEHFIFTTHAHIALFLALTLVFLFYAIFGVELHFPVLFAYAIWLLTSLKRYFKRGWFRTLFTYLVINFIYISFATVYIVLSATLRFLIF